MKSSRNNYQDKVPTLSFQDWLKGDSQTRQNFAENLFAGMKKYGFIILKDHGIEDSDIANLYDKSEKLFNLETQEKIKYHVEKGGGQRGYTPFGLEHAKGAAHKDLKEFWHVGREIEEGHELGDYYPKNIWPKELPDFKEAMLKHYQNMDKVALSLLDALGHAMKLPEDYFRNLAEEGNNILRLINYPSSDDCESKDEGSIRAEAHGDINLITLLVGASAPGLQLQRRDGTWLDVISGPGEIVVDAGDMMARITNEIIPATIHRVINASDEKSARMSMPFFVHPNHTKDLICIPSCEGEGAKYPPINSHDFLLERLRDIGLM